MLTLFALALASTATANENTIQVSPTIRAELRMTKNPTEDAKLQFVVDGKLRQTFPNLGGSFMKIDHKGGLAKFVVIDLDRDGFNEVVVRSTQEPLIGSIWVFAWDDKEKAFALIEAAVNGDRYIHVPLEGAVHLSPEGELSYAMPDRKTKISYVWKGKKFVLK